METTMTLARSFSISPFDIMEADTDNVILLINHFLEREPESKPAPKPKVKDTFWDF